jgi:hypothetical protein
MNDNSSFIRGGLSKGSTRGGKGSSLSNEAKNRVNHLGRDVNY